MPAEKNTRGALRSALDRVLSAQLTNGAVILDSLNFIKACLEMGSCSMLYTNVEGFT
jgi:tRNA uridine 5-carbamoylmethylation protein Kti12